MCVKVCFLNNPLRPSLRILPSRSGVS